MAHCVFLARKYSTNTFSGGENEKRRRAGVSIPRQSKDSIHCSELELEFDFKCVFFALARIYEIINMIL